MADYWDEIQNDPELQKRYLAQLLYGENNMGLEEPEALAIGDAVLNRVGKRGYKSNLVDTIRQPKQFTPFSNPEKVAAFNESSPAWQQYYAYAEKILDPQRPRSPYTHYYAPDKASPFWKDDLLNLTQVGRHMFGTENPEARRRSPAALARKRESRKKK